jgi:hypothetical protein
MKIVYMTGRGVCMLGRGVVNKHKFNIPKNVSTVQKINKTPKEVKEDKPVMNELVDRLQKLNVKKKYINI